MYMYTTSATSRHVLEIKMVAKRAGMRVGKVPATEGLRPGLIQRPSGGLEISS